MRTINYAVVVILTLVCCLTGIAGEKATDVFLCFGVYTQHYGLEQALSNCTFTTLDAHAKGFKNFPSSKTLETCKLVILSDVSGTEFTPEEIEQITTYVKQGGKILILGGPMTFGVGRFSECGFKDMIPVTLQPFDLKWEKEGVTFKKVSDNPMTAGLDFKDKPMVYWIHQVEPVEKSKVLLKAGKYPLLITGTYGKGTVIVFTGTPMGIPNKGDLPFWKWSGWPTLIQQIERSTYP